MRRRWPFVLAVVALVVAGLFPFLAKGTSELPVYTTGAARMLEGAEVYRPVEDAKPFAYPPFFALPFVPFAWLPDGAHRAAWYFVNVGLLFAAVALVRSALIAALGRRPTAWTWLAIWALAARHVLAVFQNQSHDLFILLLVASVAWSWGRGHRLAAGGWAGVAGACKATPLLFGVPFALPLAALRRPWLPVGLGLGFAAASLLPDLLLPRPDGRPWLVAWYEIMVAGIGVGDTAARAGVWNAASYLNQGLSGTLYRLTTPVEEATFVTDVALVELGPGGRKGVILIAQLAVIAVIAWNAWRRPRALSPAERSHRALGEVGLVACGMVLLSPMSSKSHFCVLLVPAAFAVAEYAAHGRDRLLLVLLVAAFALGTLTTKGVLPGRAGELALASGAVTWGTVALLGAAARGMGLAACRVRRAAADPASP